MTNSRCRELADAIDRACLCPLRYPEEEVPKSLQIYARIDIDLYGIEHNVVQSAITSLVGG